MIFENIAVFVELCFQLVAKKSQKYSFKNGFVEVLRDKGKIQDLMYKFKLATCERRRE